jgi:oligopeptide/dipeptide ABC transporter ATP-binding protein
VSETPILEIAGLKKEFAVGSHLWFLGGARATVKAVQDVSLSVQAGQNYGLVGESGCGKSTLARLVLALERPSAGVVRYRGEDVHRMSGAPLRRFRQATHVVFQDSGSSLSPRMRVREIVGEPLVFHRAFRGSEKKARVREVLQLVGLPMVAGDRYPHEFSGGQRQRVAVARAIASRPELIVLDEPVSALDISIRAQILNLLKDLQEQLGLTYLLIAHDLAVVYQVCDVIGVMYLGRLMEEAPAEELFRNPLHPYTISLLNSIPQPDPDRRGRRVPLAGEIPSPMNPPSGCPFRTRCPQVVAQCAEEVPAWREVAPNHRVACIRV